MGCGPPIRSRSPKLPSAIKLRATKLHLSRLVTSTGDKVPKHGWKVLQLVANFGEKLSNHADRSQICYLLNILNSPLYVIPYLLSSGITSPIIQFHLNHDADATAEFCCDKHSIIWKLTADRRVIITATKIINFIFNRF